MITVDARFAFLLSLLPLILGRLRMVAALAGGGWLVGIELSPLSRVGLLLVAVAVIVVDTLLTNPATYGTTAPAAGAGAGRSAGHRMGAAA
ncbi:hypothetical protein ACT1U9_32830 (plasmid) [Streptomyces sp. BR1]|uniref:hypothetical protein n=1 Tax=Streptomyces sp. BR1 TaxID=1592323 RepID=UPI00402B2836